MLHLLQSWCVTIDLIYNLTLYTDPWIQESALHQYATFDKKISQVAEKTCYISTHHQPDHMFSRILLPMGPATDCHMATRYNFVKATSRKNKSGQVHTTTQKKQREVLNHRLLPKDSVVGDTTPSSDTDVGFQSEYVFLDGNDPVQGSDEDEYVWVP